MKAFIQRFCIALFLVSLSGILFAQEKTQAYYNTHEHEILPDARTAFRNGNYTRAIELCNWHYIILGDNAADSLREKAERCAQLSTKMIEYRDAEMIDEAIEAAKTLLSLNTNDTIAKELLEELEKPDEQIPLDTVIVDLPVVMDTVTTDKPIEEPPINDVTQEVDQHTPYEIVSTSSSTQVEPVSPRTSQSLTRFVIKAGATVLDMKQFAQTVAPGASLGVYDMGGSPLGMEAGFYICSGLAEQSASLFGLDASLVFRATSNIYPKAGLGFFSCKSTDEADATTKGMCAFAGLTFFIGRHFCLEIGAKYYPKVCVSSLEKVSTAGVSYDFPASREILTGGICPGVSIGVVF